MARIYSCGPTVYNYAHLGNLRAYVFTDTLRRALNWKGWATLHVINITDVGHLTSDRDEGEDKLEGAAKRLNTDIWEIAAHYTKVFKQDLEQLNILPPSIWSTATDHIQEMIEFGSSLERRGYTYRIPTGLYFDTSRAPHYGWLARADLQGQREGARVDIIQGKRNPSDFAIWRSSPPDETRLMEWASPWGPGAPGWHLECSVMSTKYLGPRFDIHTGGIDHREIHHCNEIAQNQAFSGTEHPGANWWMHNAFLGDKTGKMSKSKGEFTTLRNLTARGVHPLTYRLVCLLGHYRTTLDFSSPVLQAAVTRLNRIVRAVATLREECVDDGALRLYRESRFTRGSSFRFQRQTIEAGLSAHARGFVERFDTAISNDLMTPEAIPILEEAIATESLSPQERLRMVVSLDLALGLNLLNLDLRQLSVRPDTAALDATQVEQLLMERGDARARKDFRRADVIRAQLAQGSVEIMDGDPMRWKWRPDIETL